VLQTLSRNSYVVAANDLAELLGLLRESIRCVVINTCWSAEQAQQIAEKVGCVVCITGPIDDDTAIVFSKVFYSSLAYQDIGVGKAFSLALNDLRMGHFPNADQFQLVTSKETNPDQIVFVTNQTLEAIAVPA
jgi:hypothetical protein